MSGGSSDTDQSPAGASATATGNSDVPESPSPEPAVPSGEPPSEPDTPVKRSGMSPARSQPVRSRPDARARAELPDGLPKPRRYWAILTLMSVLIITVLDSTMVNVALPNIARSLDIPPADVVRVVLAYNLAVVVTLLPFSAVAERIGFRRMFAVGVGIFGLASLASALPSFVGNNLTGCEVHQHLECPHQVKS